MPLFLFRDEAPYFLGALECFVHALFHFLYGEGADSAFLGCVHCVRNRQGESCVHAVFFVKPIASEDDRMSVAFSGVSEGDKIKFSRAEYCRTIIQCMVTGWKGVKIDGQEVPYAFELLADFPRIKDKNVYLELGGFILKHTDIRSKDSSLKKD